MTDNNIHSMKDTGTLEMMPKAISNLSEQITYLTKELLALSKRLTAMPATEPQEGFITLDEACEVVHLCKPTVYKLVQKGLIPYYRPAKELLFRRSELIKWVEESGRMNKFSMDDISEMMSSTVKRKPKPWG